DDPEQPLVELVRTERVINAVVALEQARQNVVEVGDRVRVVGTEMGDRTLGPMPDAVPELALGITLAAEHQELALGPARHEHGNGFGLAKPGEVIEIAVGPIIKVCVAAPDFLRGCRDYGDAVRPDELHEMAAAAGKFLTIHGSRTSLASVRRA